MQSLFLKRIDSRTCTMAYELRSALQQPLPLLERQHHRRRREQPECECPHRDKFRKITRKADQRVTVFGSIWAGNDVNTMVQQVEDMICEPWFIDNIAEESDVSFSLATSPGIDDRLSMRSGTCIPLR
ncbi:Vacuolar protein [Mycena venus]|uniref:Vacuolar protein n=1 Tax=Mycena venus TaxID=2733690 RepID=A0A8H7CXX5_9AGAR|nr:Vacuolar protein [Mycena venus]